jgi:outer membrane protein assembly factor BamB
MSMRSSWRTEVQLSDLVVGRDGTLLGIEANNVVAIDRDGGVVRRHRCDRLPTHMKGSVHGGVVSSYERNEPSVVALIDWQGNERWRYEEDWLLQHDGLQARGDEVLLTGRTATNGGARISLDASTGAVRRRDELAPPQAFATTFPAGRWWIARIDEGEGGLQRIDPASGASTVLTTTSHVALGLAEDAIYVDTTGYESPSNVIAFDISTGAEKWRRRGDLNLTFGLDQERLAFVSGQEDGRRAVVCDRRTGAISWASDPLGPLPDDNYFECLVNDHAIVVFGSYEYVGVYGYASSTPRLFREAVVTSKRSCALDGSRYLESGRDGLTCWDLA